MVVKENLTPEPDNEPANAAVQGILHRQQTATHCHPANAKAIPEFAEGTGAEVLRGALRYPSDSSGWQLGASTLASTLRTKSATRRWTQCPSSLTPTLH
jgi:hypothetical protein